MTNLLKSLTNSVKHWYIPMILGFMLILCGIYIFDVPLETYISLSILFSISFIVSGIFDIVFSISNSKSLNGWGWYLVSGLLSVVMGSYLIVNPAISIAMLPFVAGFTVMFRSFQLLGFSLDLKDSGISSWGNLAITSVLGILLSFMLIANPLFAGISLVTLTALAFIFAGISSVILAFGLKKMKDYPSKLSNELKERIKSIHNDLNRELRR